MDGFSQNDLDRMEYEERMAEQYHCEACGREELACSLDPCEQVRIDRGE